MDRSSVCAATAWAERVAMLAGVFAVAAAVLAVPGGCEKKGPAEKAGESIDNAAEEVGDAVKDATN